MGEASRWMARIVALAMIFVIAWCAQGAAFVPDLRREGMRVAQSAQRSPTSSGAASRAPDRNGGEGVAEAEGGWLRRAYGLYRRVIVRRLSEGTAQEGGRKARHNRASQRKGTARRGAGDKAAREGGGISAFLVRWLGWAHGVYQQNVVMRLTGKRQLGFAPPVPREAAVPPSNGGSVEGAGQSPARVAEAEKARAEAQRLEAQRDREAAAEARRRAEEDARRIAEERRKVAEKEQEKAAEAARKRADERAKAAALAEEARRAADVALAEVQRRAAREAETRRAAEAQAAALRAAAEQKAQEAVAAAHSERARQEKLAAEKREADHRRDLARAREKAARERAAREAARGEREEAERVAREHARRAASTHPKENAARTGQAEREPGIAAGPSPKVADEEKATAADKAQPKTAVAERAQAGASRLGRPRADAAVEGDRKPVANAHPSPGNAQPDTRSAPESPGRQVSRASTLKLPPPPERRKSSDVAATGPRKSPSSTSQSPGVTVLFRKPVPLPVRSPAPRVVASRPAVGAKVARPGPKPRVAQVVRRQGVRKRCSKVARVHRRCRYRTRRKIRPPGYYVVRRGDSLWRIARRHYARGRYFQVIYRANRRRIGKARLIYPCQRLYIPARRRYRRR